MWLSVYTSRLPILIISLTTVFALLVFICQNWVRYFVVFLEYQKMHNVCFSHFISHTTFQCVFMLFHLWLTSLLSGAHCCPMFYPLHSTSTSPSHCHQHQHVVYHFIYLLFFCVLNFFISEQQHSYFLFFSHSLSILLPYMCWCIINCE